MDINAAIKNSVRVRHPAIIILKKIKKHIDQGDFYGAFRRSMEFGKKKRFMYHAPGSDEYLDHFRGLIPSNFSLNEAYYKLNDRHTEENFNIFIDALMNKINSNEVKNHE